MSLEQALADCTAAIHTLVSALKNETSATTAVVAAAPAVPVATTAPATTRKRRTQAEIQADEAAAKVAEAAAKAAAAMPAGNVPISNVTDDEITNVFLDYMNFGDDKSAEDEKVRDGRQAEVVNLLGALGAPRAKAIPQPFRRLAVDWVERMTEGEEEIDFAAELAAQKAAEGGGAPPKRSASSLV